MDLPYDDPSDDFLAGLAPPTRITPAGRLGGPAGALPLQAARSAAGQRWRRRLTMQRVPRAAPPCRQQASHSSFTWRWSCCWRAGRPQGARRRKRHARQLSRAGANSAAGRRRPSQHATSHPASAAAGPCRNLQLCSSSHVSCCAALLRAALRASAHASSSADAPAAAPACGDSQGPQATA